MTMKFVLYHQMPALDFTSWGSMRTLFLVGFIFWFFVLRANSYLGREESTSTRGSILESRFGDEVGVKHVFCDLERFASVLLNLLVGSLS